MRCASEREAVAHVEAARDDELQLRRESQERHGRAVFSDGPAAASVRCRKGQTTAERSKGTVSAFGIVRKDREADVLAFCAS